MVLLRRLVTAACLSLVSEGAIAQTPPQPAAPAWHASPFGEADTLGALNNLSPDIVKKASRRAHLHGRARALRGRGLHAQRQRAGHRL
jgi:hypothetical protein